MEKQIQAIKDIGKKHGVDSPAFPSCHFCGDANNPKIAACPYSRINARQLSISGTDVPLQSGCSVHHRCGRQHNVVFESYGFPFQLPLGGAFDGCPVVPGVVLVRFAFRSVSRRARIFRRREKIGDGVRSLIGFRPGGKNFSVRISCRTGNQETLIYGGFYQLVWSEIRDGHGIFLRVERTLGRKESPKALP